jgi:hypothetical protein
MQSFVQRYASEIKGVLSGFDRLRFRGTLCWLSSLSGMGSFLGSTGILLKDFCAWAEARTERIRQASERLAQSIDQKVKYLPSAQESKESIALAIAAERGMTQGLVCVLSCVEPCRSFRVGRNREKKMLELRYEPMKCLHHYFYVLHPQMGLLHVRLQTWAPFTVFIGINGREWLARQLVAGRIPFEQRDNCFVDVADVDRAQALLDQQLKTRWSRRLDALLRSVHPAHARLFGQQSLDYYWSAEQTEWATDVMFRSREELARVYPRFLRQAMTTFDSGQVLRFLGQSPNVRYYKTAEIASTLKTRPEGACVRHSRNQNSLKMYDKQETVLRVETTINDPRDLKVLRPKASDPKKRKTWQRMRKGVADLHRRAQVSQKSNERYLEALAAVDHTASLGETVQPLCQPTHWKGRSVRGLQPLQKDDARLPAAMARGDFLLSGFRNRDLRALLFGTAKTSHEETRRQSAKITRLIRMLRAHGLVHKVPKTHRYQATPAAQSALTALTAAQHASIETLTTLAA